MGKEPKQVIMEQLRSYEHMPSDLAGMGYEQKYYLQEINHKASLPLGANTTTLQFLKENSIPKYQVHAITVADNAGISWMLFCLVVQDALGNWQVEGWSGRGNYESMSFRPSRLPYIILHWSDTSNHFYAGCIIVDPARIGIAKARLLAEGELISEDTVQDGLAIFVSDQKNVQMPIEVELYNHSDELVRTFKRQP